jgi:hypothetical protein
MLQRYWSGSGWSNLGWLEHGWLMLVLVETRVFQASTCVFVDAKVIGKNKDIFCRRHVRLAARSGRIRFVRLETTQPSLLKTRSIDADETGVKRYRLDCSDVSAHNRHLASFATRG